MQKTELSTLEKPKVVVLPPRVWKVPLEIPLISNVASLVQGSRGTLRSIHPPSAGRVGWTRNGWFAVPAVQKWQGYRCTS